MRKYIYSLLFWIIMINCCAQKPSDSIIRYNRFVNKAELLITSSKLDSALNYYDSAFRFKRYPFAKDIWNASICATTLKKYERTSLLLILLLNKGLSIDYLKSKNFFHDYFYSEYSYNLLQSPNYNKAQFDIQYRHQLDSLIVMDELFRKKANCYSVYLDTISKIDKSNVRFFNELIQKNGFPTEEKIGLDENMLTLPVYYLLIRHQQAGSQTRCTDFTLLLKEAIFRGDIELHYGIDLLEGVDGNNYFGTQDLCLIKCKLESNIDSNTKDNNIEEYGYENINPEIINKFNTRRIEVGLESRDDYFKKLIFCTKNKNYIFGSGNSFRTYYWSSNEDYTAAKKNLIYIK